MTPTIRLKVRVDMTKNLQSPPQMTAEQEEIVRHWGSSLAIQAGAGSGKTTTLVQKCLALVERNPDASFAAVSFTEKSAADLKQKLSAKLAARGLTLNADANHKGHWVMTIHGFCRAIIREFPIEAGFQGTEQMLSESDSTLLWERVVDSLWYDEQSPRIALCLERLLTRENRGALTELLTRLRSLEVFGVIETMKQKPGEPPSDSHRLAELAEFCLERYRQKKKREMGLDFNDLESGALRAIGFQDVRDYFRRRFDLLMIDEFQDTNPIQAQIIWAISKQDQANLVVVGDPKQSIYRFRDADVSVFESLCSQLSRNLSLTYNFRSRPQIIDFCNDVCEPLFLASKLNYEPLVAKRQASDDGHSVVQLSAESPAQLAAWLLAEKSSGKDFSEFALIVRRVRGRTQSWLKVLSEKNIPLAIGGGGLFWEDPRAIELVHFLKFWDQPSNRLSAATFFRAPWVGVPDEILDRWFLSPKKADEHSPQASETVDLWELFFQTKHWLADKLCRLRSQVIRPGELVSLCFDDLGVSSELGQVLLAVYHRCEELSCLGLGFSEVVGELSRAMQEHRREKEVPPPRQRGQLSVFTVHASKGLEFENVILIDFGLKPERAFRAPWLFWDRSQGSFFAPRDENNDRDKKSIEDKNWKNTEREKELAEVKRVFYVALTRAKERLILVKPPELPVADDSDTSSSKEKVSPYLQDFWRGWVDEADSRNISEFSGSVMSVKFSEKSDESLDDGSGDSQTLIQSSSRPLRRRSRHSVSEWLMLASCERRYFTEVVLKKSQPKVFSNQQKKDSEFDESVSDRVSQTDLGTRVHRALELEDLAGLDQIEAEVGSSRFQARWVKNWLRTASHELPDGWCRQWCLPEQAFEMVIKGAVCVGAIDRIELFSATDHAGVKQDEDFVVITDFKFVSSVEDSDAILKKYELQLRLYELAVAKLLKRPEIRVCSRLVVFSKDFETGVSEIWRSVSPGLSPKLRPRKLGEATSDQVLDEKVDFIIKRALELTSQIELDDLVKIEAELKGSKCTNTFCWVCQSR